MTRRQREVEELRKELDAMEPTRENRAETMAKLREITPRGAAAQFQACHVRHCQMFEWLSGGAI